MAEQERETHRFVCVGLRAYRGGRFALTYLDENGEKRAWKKANLGGVIGGVYEVEIEGDPSSVYSDTSRYVSIAEGREEEIAKWRLLDRAARAEQEAIRAERRAKESNGDLGDLTLREIREIMRGQLGHQRHGMLTAVSAYISGGY